MRTRCLSHLISLRNWHINLNLMAPCMGAAVIVILRHEELNQLTGIAAILTYPLDVEVVEAEERAEAEERERKRLEAAEAAG